VLLLPLMLRIQLAGHLVTKPGGFGQHVVQLRQHVAETLRRERLALPFLGHGSPRYVSRRRP
jgi:hypothetical protein